jgi:hypothetical protein
MLVTIILSAQVKKAEVSRNRTLRYYQVPKGMKSMPVYINFVCGVQNYRVLMVMLRDRAYATLESIPNCTRGVTPLHVILQTKVHVLLCTEMQCKCVPCTSILSLISHISRNISSVVYVHVDG